MFSKKYFLSENQSASLKLLEMFWIHCCHFNRVLKLHWKRSFLVTLFVRCCEFVYFNVFINFRWIFFPAPLVDCFVRMLNKQARLSKKKEKLSKAERFSTRDLYRQYCSGYAGILPWTSGIPPGRYEMKNVLVSWKHNSKFMTVMFWSCLLSRPTCYPFPALI